MPTDPHKLKEGDEVSWKWGQGHPTGEVKDVVDGTAEVKTKRGNTVKKDGDEENPAVVLNTGQSDAIKKVSQALLCESLPCSVASDDELCFPTSFATRLASSMASSHEV